MSKKYISQDGTYSTSGDTALFVTPGNAIIEHGQMGTPQLAQYSNHQEATAALQNAVKSKGAFFQFPPDEHNSSKKDST